ncbi:MAG: hypothetical protein RIR01_1920 [Bacteroidota bacterium]|jgi:hypothetical protein
MNTEKTSLEKESQTSCLGAVIGCKFFLIMALQRGYNADIPHRLYLTEEDAKKVADEHNRNYDVKWVVKEVKFDEKIYCL